MSSDRDTTRIVRSWLEDGVNHLPDTVLGAVLAELPTTRQRRATWLPVPWFPMMNASVRYGLAAVTGVVAALIGFSVLVAPNLGAPGLGEPTSTPLPSAREMPLEPWGAPLDAGRYSLADPFPVRLTFQVGSGWAACPVGGHEQGICSNATPPGGETGVGISFMIIANVAENPCAVVLPDPPIGPTVDDLVAAITGLRYRELTEPVDASVGGFPAKRFTITHPATSRCGNTWATSERTNGTGPTEINEIYVVDAGGTRVLISTASYPGTDESLLSAAEEVISSIQIEP